MFSYVHTFIQTYCDTDIQPYLHTQIDTYIEGRRCCACHAPCADALVALRHVAPAVLGAVPQALAAAVWLMVRGLMVTSATTTLPGSSGSSSSKSLETAPETAGAQ